MQKQKIVISHSRYEHEFQIELRTLRKWWFISWWVTDMFRRGTKRDIGHYKEAWSQEFNITEIEELTL